MGPLLEDLTLVLLLRVMAADDGRRASRCQLPPKSRAGANWNRKSVPTIVECHTAARAEVAPTVSWPLSVTIQRGCPRTDLPMSVHRGDRIELHSGISVSFRPRQFPTAQLSADARAARAGCDDEDRDGRVRTGRTVVIGYLPPRSPDTTAMMVSIVATRPMPAMIQPADDERPVNLPRLVSR
jgi:hypothetical protein